MLDSASLTPSTTRYLAAMFTHFWAWPYVKLEAVASAC